MAGRMSTADFELIKDSINEAVEKFVEYYNSRSTSSERPTVSPNPSPIWVETNLRRELGQSFSSRLKYTNDSFDTQRFKNAIIRHH